MYRLIQTLCLVISSRRRRCGSDQWSDPGGNFSRLASGPALVLIGGVFFSAVRDFASMYASVKNKGRTIGYIIEEHIGKL